MTIKKYKKEHINFVVSAAYDAETFFLLNEKKLKNTKNPSDFDDIAILSNKFGVAIHAGLTKKCIEKFVQSIYEKNINEISNQSKEVKNRWKKNENDFFNLAKNVYKKDATLNEKYLAFPSVWSSFVRDFANKRISFPCDRGVNDALFVIAHELLHVIFYQYLYENHPKIRNIIESKKVWDFSEVINVIIQGQKEWVGLFILKPRAYSEHEYLYEKMSDTWNKNHDVDVLIEKFLY
jgi:hypothetical protein